VRWFKRIWTTKKKSDLRAGEATKPPGLWSVVIARVSVWRRRFSGRYYLASDDPDFESKAADIIGLYLNPPQHAAVFCVDEKTAI
jgi:hypothetical protein